MSLFITFEGPEGSGKSTIIKNVKEYLSKTYKVTVTREPGGIPISEKIRELILDEHSKIDGHTEALLFAASRREHLVQKVLPALKQGNVVLCDRFIDSSLAYQGYARGLGFDAVFQINKFAIETHMPDLTIYLQIDPKVGLARKQGNQLKHNRLDNEKLDFHEHVYLGYNELLEKYPERIKRVDASQDKQTVLKDTLEIIDDFINLRGE